VGSIPTSGTKNTHTLSASQSLASDRPILDEPTSRSVIPRVLLTTWARCRWSIWKNPWRLGVTVSIRPTRNKSGCGDSPPFWEMWRSRWWTILLRFSGRAAAFRLRTAVGWRGRRHGLNERPHLHG